MTDATPLPPPADPPALMAELEAEARELLSRGNSPALAAQLACVLRGLSEADHVAIDLAERIRR